MEQPGNVVKIREAVDERDYRLAKELFLEYVASLSFDLDFQDFEAELASLPGEYAPPRGCLLLAEVREVRTESVAAKSAPAGIATAGCVAMRPFSQGVCEMKRLYVRPGYRGMGIGLALSKAVIVTARERGYDRMRLDTVASMVQAARLYEDLGFREIQPYRHNPLPGARFFELRLRKVASPNC